MKFRKKPVVVEAEQFFRMKFPLAKGVLYDMFDYPDGQKPGRFHVITIHGQETAIVDGDWIIAEPDGEHYYPCKPDIFEATYEPVDSMTKEGKVTRGT